MNLTLDILEHVKKCAQNAKWFPYAHLYTKTISHTSCIGCTNCISTSFVLHFPFANYLMELLIFIQLWAI